MILLIFKYLRYQSIMEHHVVYIAAVAGLVVHSVLSADPIFKHIFDYVALNGFNDINFRTQVMNRLWLVGVALILNGLLQEIVKWDKVAVARPPVHTVSFG